MGFFSRKKELVDDGTVKMLADLFYMSCALAQCSDYGHIILAFNENGKFFVKIEENVTLGIALQAKSEAECNERLKNFCKDFPCTYRDIMWYFDVLKQKFDSRYDFKKEMYGIIPNLSPKMERAYYEAIRAYLKEQLPNSTYEKLEFDDSEYWVRYAYNL